MISYIHIHPPILAIVLTLSSPRHATRGGPDAAFTKLWRLGLDDGPNRIAWNQAPEDPFVWLDFCLIHEIHEKVDDSLKSSGISSNAWSLLKQKKGISWASVEKCWKLSREQLSCFGINPELKRHPKQIWNQSGTWINPIGLRKVLWTKIWIKRWTLEGKEMNLNLWLYKESTLVYNSSIFYYYTVIFQVKRRVNSLKPTI